jgi:endonuclease III
MASKPAVPKPPKSPADTRKIIATLSTQHPGADTELDFRNAYELLVATILSAQCTDERVNQVTPSLFERYPDATTLAKATTGELEPQIQSTGFFRAKSRALVGMATEVVEQHGGNVPKTMEALVTLPGVGRKTANVVLGHALGVPGLPVDRHVLRVANRIGIATSEDPEVVEQQLGTALPPTDWTRASDTLILHGRRICKPKPLCPECAVRPDCLYYRNVISKAAPAISAKRRASKKSDTKSGAESPPENRTENAPAAVKRRVPKARGRERGGAALAKTPASLAETKRTRGAPESRSEGGSLIEQPRAPKVRGTN